MEEKEINDLESIKKLEKYIDSNFLLLSNMVNDKYDELQNKINKSPEKITSSINKVIVDTAHKLYADMCNENFKKLEETKKKILFRVNAIIGIGVIIIFIELANFFKR